MIDIREKYQAYRAQAQDGDVVLWSGSRLLPRIIKNCDSFYIDDEGNKVKDPCFATHASITYWGKAGRLHNIDSWSQGIVVVPASLRMKLYDDFCVLRPKVLPSQIDAGLNWALDSWESEIKYDYFTLPRIAIIKKTGIDITGLGDKAKFICSEFTRRFTLQLNIEDYNKRKLFTPQDHLRFMKEESLELLFKEQ